MEKLPPNNAHRIYVLDEAFLNEIDARVHLFDGDTYRRLGQIDAGFSPKLLHTIRGMGYVMEPRDDETAS